MKEQIKELRVKLDGLAQLTKKLKPINPGDYTKTEQDKFEVELWFQPFNSKEIEKAYDSLILAKAWLGKVLGELGESVWVTNLDNYKDNYVAPITLPCEMDVIKDKHTPNMLWVIHKPSGKQFEIYEHQYSKTPYANDGNRKTVKDIEPATDKVVNLFEVSNNLEHWGKDFNTLNHIEKVDWLRQEISNVFKEWKKLENFKGLHFSTVISFEQHIQEARFWLGFELGRVRDEQK